MSNGINNTAKREIRDILANVAKQRGTISYSSLATRLRSISLAPDSPILHSMLGDVSVDEDAAGRGMLSVLVVHKVGDMQPGNGFFELAKRLGRDVSDREACWIAEMKLVYAAWSKSATPVRPAAVPLPPAKSALKPRGVPGRPLPVTPAAAPSKPLAERTDEDLEYLRDAATVVMRRRHNEMTNALRAACRKFGVDVQEGSDPSCLFDALILGYRRGERHLLVEVKTEGTAPFCRMAVGQLLDYRRQLPERDNIDLAVLLPGPPEDDMVAYLADVDVKVLWFDGSGGIPGLR